MPLGVGPDAARWRLLSTETSRSGTRALGVVRAPSVVSGVSVDLGLKSTSVGGVMDAEMSSLRTASDPRRASISADWYATDTQDDIRPIARTLERLAAHDPVLGRPPIVQLQWSTTVDIVGTIDSLRFEWIHGLFPVSPHLPRAFTAHFEVKRQLERTLEFTTRFDPETTYRRVGPGETFEVVAQAAYGDPDQGTLLRRVNTHIPVTGEVAGDVVKVLDETHPDMRRSTQPVSPALVGDLAVLQRFAEERLAVRFQGFAAVEAGLGLP